MLGLHWLYMQNKSFKNDSEAEKYIRQFDSRDKLNKTNTPYLLMTGLDPIWIHMLIIFKHCNNYSDDNPILGELAAPPVFCFSSIMIF